LGEYVKKLESVGPDTERVGMKANRLGGMLSAGLPVPSGFVLTTEAYIKFLRHNKIANRMSKLLEESYSSNLQRTREISGEMQNMIINGIMPDFIEKDIKEEYQDLSIGREAKEIGGAALDLIRAGRDNVSVAVRPSPSTGGIINPNFSGQMKTILCQRGHSRITYAIKECWASLFSPRAMLYRKKKRVRDMPSMGVIVQKSLEPEKAGFAFTNRPETGDSSRMVIEGSWGFSDSIISGTVSPDEYIVSKETGDTESRKTRKKSWLMKRNGMTGKIEREPVLRDRIEADLLDAKEIGKIYELAARVEKHFGGHPQELEWCEERGRIFLIDASPVPDHGIASQEGVAPDRKPIAKGICAFRGTLKGNAKVFSSMSDMQRIEKGDILVTKMTVPEILPVMEKLSGIIADGGSRSCHAAVIAREFGIPCIVLAGDATSSIGDGQGIILDATSGEVFGVPEPAGQALPHEVTASPLQQPQAPLNPPWGTGTDPGMPLPGWDHVTGRSHEKIPGGLDDEGITATGIKSIISIPAEIKNSPEISDGVGLLRAEHLVTETGKHPFYLLREVPENIISSLASGLSTTAKAFYPKPVWYRSLDVKTDEFRELEGGEEEPRENNPLMGWHGIRRSIDQPDFLKIEIEVIKRLYKEGLDNIVLGLPFISSVGELRTVKQIAGPALKIGIMVETPAAGLEMEGFCKEGIAFASIGLNDLTQLTLGVDRDNSMISKLYSELNPAVISLLKHILRTCRKHSVETSVYGDFVSDERIAESLVGLGVGSISTEPENIGSMRATISRTERKLILERMRK
jgi:pyruvate,water dikinase